MRPPPIRHKGLASVAVDFASAEFSFSSGLGMLERGSVVTSSYSADVQGWIGLLDGSLGLNGAILPGAPILQGVTTAPAVEPIGFSIGGTLAAPAATAN